MAHSQDTASWFAPPDEEGWGDHHDNDEYEAGAEIEATDEDFIDMAYGHERAVETNAGPVEPSGRIFAAPAEEAADDGWILESVDRDRGSSSAKGGAASLRPSRLAQLDEPAWALGPVEEEQSEAWQDEGPDANQTLPEPHGGEEAAQSEWYGDEERACRDEHWEDEDATAHEEARLQAGWGEGGSACTADDSEGPWEEDEADCYEDQGYDQAAWEDEEDYQAGAEASSYRPGDSEEAEDAPRVVRARVAGMQSRALAWAIDGALVLSTALTLIWVAGMISGSGKAVSGVLQDAALTLPAAIFMAVMGAFYSAVSVTLLGRTVGGLLAKVKILDCRGEPPDLLRASLRGLIASFGVLALGVALVWVLLDERGQTLQDRLAGTFVVEG